MSERLRAHFARASACVVVLLGATATASHAGDRVPKAMLGMWARGRCSNAAQLLTITQHTATLGTSKPQAIVYFANDAGPGNGAIHWKQEGNVDNFVYAPAKNAIVYNAQGYHMPGQVLYKRCPPMSP